MKARLMLRRVPGQGKEEVVIAFGVVTDAEQWEEELIGDAVIELTPDRIQPQQVGRSVDQELAATFGCYGTRTATAYGALALKACQARNDPEAALEMINDYTYGPLRDKKEEQP